MAFSRHGAHVLIVGGGGTGAALAHDLALRGLRVTLVERGELTSGTTGRHHGLLHSGGRYAVGDRESAVEGFVTITGGKATTLRGMAELCADVICHKLDIDEPCRTKDTVLLPADAYYTAAAA